MTNDQELKKLRVACNEFAEAMYNKLKTKYRREGYVGWDDPSTYPVLENGLADHATKAAKLRKSIHATARQIADNYVDLANYCMFLWRMEANDCDAPKTISILQEMWDVLSEILEDPETVKIPTYLRRRANKAIAKAQKEGLDGP